MDIVERTRDGDVVCRGCGLVVSDSVYVDQEWRSFANDGVTADNDRCRVGMAMDIVNCSAMGTTISGERSQAHKLSRTQQQVNPMSGLDKLMKEMAQIMESNRVAPPLIAESLANLRLVCSSVKEAGGQLRDIPAKMAVCTYYAHKGGIRMDVVRRWFGCSKKTFGRVRKGLSETFQKQQQGVSKQHKMFIRSIVNSLVVREEEGTGRMHGEAGKTKMAIINKANEIGESLKQANIGQSFMPSLFMSAVVWKAISMLRQQDPNVKVDKVLDIPKSLEGMADHCKVKLPTLSSHCHVVEEHLLSDDV
jgi:transcription initiation factor TFIIIB Brf1 subunit/transcription initiation factor TFIIB